MCSLIKRWKKKLSWRFIEIFKGINNKFDEVRDRKMNFLMGDIVKYVNKFLKGFVELEDFRNMKYFFIYIIVEFRVRLWLEIK